jgi:hypothetical protein
VVAILLVLGCSSPAPTTQIELSSASQEPGASYDGVTLRAHVGASVALEAHSKRRDGTNGPPVQLTAAASAIRVLPCERDGVSLVVAAAPGTTTLLASADGVSVEVPVVVAP